MIYLTLPRTSLTSVEGAHSNLGSADESKDWAKNIHNNMYYLLYMYIVICTNQLSIETLPPIHNLFTMSSIQNLYNLHKLYSGNDAW